MCCYICILLNTLIAVSINLLTAGAAYSSLSMHSASTVHGKFGQKYMRNISRTEPVSIFYNQSHHQVTVHSLFYFYFVSIN